MENKIEAVDTSYAEFNKKASELYAIPSLQRPYSWDTKEVEKLWDDILENESFFYYIGSVVVIMGEGSVSRDQIIDGQQRLTTLSLFLVAIRNYINGKRGRDFLEIGDEIKEFLIKFRRNEEQIRLYFSDNNSNNVYSAIIKNEEINVYHTDTQRRFLKNLDFIKEKLTEYSPKCKLSEIKNLFDKIKNLQIIFIKCKDRSAAYKLFESINATGISLATTDMIKNSIFESLHRDPKVLKNVENGWRDMYESFEEDSSYLKSYIRHHWISTVGYTNHSRLFDDFIEKYKKEKEMLKYADSLFNLSSVYLALREGATESLKKLPRKRYEVQEIKDTLIFLKFLGVDQVYSVILFVYNKDSENFKKDLIRFTAFQFLYKYVPGSPSAPEKKYFADYCAGKINKQDVKKGLISLCINQEAQFKKKLMDKIKYIEGKSGDVQFILEKYLYYKGGANKFARPTIEHIIPQDDSDPILKKFKCDKKDIVKKIHQLGNLTILEEGENSSKDEFNKPFSEKKNLYKKSIFKGNQNILEYPFENRPEEAIYDRGEEIASTVYKIFLEAIETGKWPTRQ
ncbi:MAG TPA: DUF262 domain-containing HNH endonuclease family protein [Candidatus Paceibacterota bacterium]|nr:DUF262 domain-containing HNH endonuclease family protein [Candidatus Paceibacterota bacterium]